MHVAIEAVEIAQALNQPSTDYGYSRGLAPWCLNRPTFGEEDNSNYWSCALAPLHTGIADARNLSYLSSVGLGFSTDDTILNFVDDNDIHIAILAPNYVPTGLDYSASTYGVSMQCQFVRNNSCIVEQMNDTGTYSPLSSFSCSDRTIGLNLSGKIYEAAMQVYEYDFHRLLHEPPPFDSITSVEWVTQNMLDAAANLSDAEASTIFNNPWRILPVLNVDSEMMRTMNIPDSDNRVFRFSTYGFLMLACNSTG